MMSVDLPEPETPVTQVKSPSGISMSRFSEIVAACPADADLVARRSRRVRSSGTGILRRPLKYWPVSELAEASISARRALRYHMAAGDAGARSQIDDVSRRADRLGIVLDDDQRVAEIAQRSKRCEQALVVALVQSDRGLIEDVHDARQARAHLACQADALRLAAGERFGAAFERQIFKPDVDQEAQPLLHLLDDLGGDLAAPAGQLQRAEESERARRSSGCAICGSVRSATNTKRAARFRRAPPHSVQVRMPKYLASSSRTVGESVSR